MRQLSKFGKQAVNAAVLSDARLLVASSINLQQNLRPYSSNIPIRFLDEDNPSNIKRGGGGRSSFSGMVATVFGATGFFGRFICNRLGKIGSQIIIPYRCEPHNTRDLKVVGDLGQVLFTPFHICDEESIRKSVKHSNVVINLIGRDWETKNFTLHQANVESAERIARISKEMGVKTLVHMSTLNVGRKQPGYWRKGGSEYIKCKALSEEVVRDAFPEAIIFRPSDMYGRHDRFLSYYNAAQRYSIKYNMSLPYAGRGIWKQPVFANDVAEGIVNAILDEQSLGKTFEAVGPRKYELCDLVDWIHRVNMTVYGGNYKRMDLKYDMFMRIKALIIKQWAKYIRQPPGSVIPDKIEREAISDDTRGLPDLEFLGVNLTLLETRIKYELADFKFYTLVGENPLDIPEPRPAPFIIP